MIVSKSHNRFRKGAKSASGAPGPKSAPRGSKSTTFGKGIFQSFQPSEICYESNKGTFHFIHSISDIPMTPSCSLRSFRNRRLVRCELQVDTGFEIYGSSIGVCNLVCNDTQFKYIPTPNVRMKLQLGHIGNECDACTAWVTDRPTGGNRCWLRS